MLTISPVDIDCFEYGNVFFLHGDVATVMNPWGLSGDWALLGEQQPTTTPERQTVYTGFDGNETLVLKERYHLNNNW